MAPYPRRCPVPHRHRHTVRFSRCNGLASSLSLRSLARLANLSPPPARPPLSSRASFNRLRHRPPSTPPPLCTTACTVHDTTADLAAHGHPDGALPRPCWVAGRPVLDSCRREERGGRERGPGMRHEARSQAHSHSHFLTLPPARAMLPFHPPPSWRRASWLLCRRATGTPRPCFFC